MFEDEILYNEMQVQVEEFHTKYGCCVNDKPTIPDEKILKLRDRLINEEALEFSKAAEEQDIIGMCDALCDLLYVTFGTCVSLGINIRPCFDLVHESNMTKEGNQDAGGKVLKGASYKPVNLEPELNKQGWIE